MDKSKNKIWFEDVGELFRSINIIAKPDMNIEEQMNSFTRLVIFVFIFLLIYNTKSAFVFLIFSTTFIIIISYIQMRNIKENYTPPNKNKIVYHQPESYRFCTKPAKQVQYHQGFVSHNQKLVGDAHPRTKVAPIIAPRSHDLDVWKKNDLIRHSHINDESHLDVHSSGYTVSDCCGNPNPTSVQHNIEQFVIEPFCFNCNDNDKGYMTHDERSKQSTADLGLQHNICNNNRFEHRTELQDYNKNIFTQTVQPGVYTYNEVQEPINDYIGISHTQQFQPVSVKHNDNGDVHYTQHDPNYVDISLPEDKTIHDVNMSNVYDPRFTGHGTSYRSYNDNMTGQTRFMYDDIDAVRMPNYITRNKIDFTDFGDRYGPIQEGDAYGNKNNTSIRELANEQWVNDSLDFRNDLMERRMRKVNNMGWQRRVAPIHTNFK